MSQENGELLKDGCVEKRTIMGKTCILPLPVGKVLVLLDVGLCPATWER